MLENFTQLDTCCEQIWRMGLEMHNIHMPRALKKDVMGFEPGRWFKLYRFKGHHTENCYQLKKEIKRLIQEGYLKKNVKGDFSHGSDMSNSWGRDKVGNSRTNKENEVSQGKGSKVVHHTFNTIIGGSVGARKLEKSTWHLKWNNN